MKPPNRALASALCVVLLTACGTDGPPTPSEPEEALHISSVAPIADPAGTQVTLQGTGFGESGRVRLGGAPVEPDAWSPGEVTLTVPDGAPPAWQSLALEPDDQDRDLGRPARVAERVRGLPRGPGPRRAPGVAGPERHLRGQRGLDRGRRGLPVPTGGERRRVRGHRQRAVRGRLGGRGDLHRLLHGAGAAGTRHA